MSISSILEHKRVRIVPEEIKTIPIDMTNTKSYSLGYSEWCLQKDIDIVFKLCSMNANQIPIVKVDSDIVSMVFNTPISFEKQNAYSVMILRKLREIKGDNVLPENIRSYLELQICIEKTVPKTIWEILLMRNDEFKVYKSKLIIKAAKRYGQSGVFLYKSKYVRGLAFIGRGEDDCRNASIIIEDLDGGISQVIYIDVIDTKEYDIKEIVLIILKTYKFKIGTIDSDSKVLELLNSAGIN